MLISERYYYLDANGPCSEPTSGEVRRLASQGTITALVLDNNVCQNLSGFVRDKSKLDLKTRGKVENLLACAELSGSDLVTGFGLLELASKRSTPNVDRQKYDSFNKDVTQAIYLNLEQIFDDRPFTRAPDIEPMRFDNAEPIRPLLGAFYCSLLQIKLLLGNGTGARVAYSNLSAFLRWADEMGLQSPLPIQVALAVFGGDSKALKLLNVKKDKDVRQVVWGAAWDMLYAFMVQQYATLVPVGGARRRAILVTGDEACYIIASRCRLRGAVEGDDRMFAPLVQTSLDYPHFRHSQSSIKELVESLRLNQIRRVADWMYTG